MRPIASHAAMSSVGKHTARESEAPNVVRKGKSAWRAPTPDFGPGTARCPGLYLFVHFVSASELPYARNRLWHRLAH
jgi:hypothetical protein